MIIALLVIIALCLLIGGDNVITLLIAGVILAVYWAFWLAVIAVAFTLLVAIAA